MQSTIFSCSFNFDAAEKLPENICFGTSSWRYPGWKGLVYNEEYKSEKDFNDHCLEEYACFPWFRALGIDSTFYAPPERDTLERYSSQLPQSISLVSKVWEEITIPRYAKHTRYGSKAGTENPNFLNADLFLEKVLEPYSSPEVIPNTGPFVFQFQSFAQGFTKDASGFLEKLDCFFQKLPKGFLYAVELRNPELLTPEYFSVLNKHCVTHCFNHWNFMPELCVQMRRAAEAGGLSADFFVCRILTPRGTNYQAAVGRFKPYDSLKEPILEMRQDVRRLAKRAIQKNVTAYILVNNRAEGNAPQSIDALGRMIVESVV